MSQASSSAYIWIALTPYPSQATFSECDIR
jgi:hypothetical protein